MATNLLPDETVPAALARAGIVSVSDNLESGLCLDSKWVAGSFSFLFRHELTQVMLRRQECAKSKPSLPCR